MGDWATTTHWIETPDVETATHLFRRLRHNTALWRQKYDDQWGLRVGYGSHNRLCVQVETVVKYGCRFGIGEWIQNTHPACHVVTCNAVYNVFLSRGPSLSGFPAWNRVIFPAHTPIKGDELLALADLQGEIISTPPYHILQLADPMPLTQARLQWDFHSLPEVQTPDVRLWEALYACHPDLYQRRERVFVGWWTPLRGHLTLGEAYLMGLQSGSPWEHGVDLFVTGAVNGLLSPFEDGTSSWALPSLDDRLLIGA